jgi:molybdenum cofactor cytidylyltransferase
VVARLLQAFQTAGRGIVVPTSNGRRGHPLLVSLRYCDEILTCYEAVGLRGLLQAHPEEVHEVEVGTARILEDVDTPLDFKRLADRGA